MHFASMSLGILDFLIEWLTAFLIWLIGWVFDLIFLLFADLLFSIGTALLEIVDMIQLIFRKLSGLDRYYVVKGGVPETFEGVDPLLSLMTNETVIQVLTALTLVSVVMVLVAAIIKIIQSEFSTEGSKNSKAGIFGQALKCLMLFVLVPVCCIGGVGVSNALLKSIDRATNISNGNATLGSSIFVSAASNANRVRCGGNSIKACLEAVGFNGTITDNNREEVAMMIDKAFKDNTVNGGILALGVVQGVVTGLAESSVNLLNGIASAQGSVVMPGQYFYQSNGIVDMYYNISEINFITYIGAALLAAMTMLNVSFGMIMRMFKGVILYMISPPMVALMPLDGGSAFKSWRKNFLGQVLAAYGTIVALNLLFIVLPVVDNIRLFAPSGNFGLGAGADMNGINSFVSILVTLTGLFMIKDLTKMISDMIGADDAAASGAGMAQKVGSTVGKVAAIGVGGVAGIAGKGIGAMLTKKAAGMAATDPAKAAKLAKTASMFGNTGNKLFQNAKGTLGGAMNKGIGAITGGGIKGHFSEETDFDKAQKAKKDRADRLENGEGTLGDFFASKGDDALTAVGNAAIAAPVKTGATVAGAVSGFAGAAPGMRVAGAMLGGSLANAAAGHMMDDFNETMSDGGAAARKKLFAKPVENTAGTAVVDSTKGTYEELAKVITANLATLQATSTANDLDTSSALASMLQALEAIATKTEEQKDLIQKLTTAKTQLDSGTIDAASLRTMFQGMGLTADPTTGAVGKIETAKTNAVDLAASFSFDVTTPGAVTDKIEVDAEALARKIAAQNGVTDATKIQAMIDKMKREMLTAYKSEIEKLKDDK